MKPTKAELKKAKNLLNRYAPKGEELAYINSKEAKLLKRIGGAGKDINGTGIKSYYGSDDYGAGEDGKGSSGPSGGGSSGGDDNNYMDYYTPSRPSMLSRAATAVGNFIKGGGVTGMVLSAIGNVSQNRTRKAQANVEIGLGSDRMSNYSVNNGGDNNNSATNVGGKIVKLAPTSAEISQSKATDVTYDSRKTKARGRSMTILTNSRGVGNNMASVLGKKSLLGAA